MQPKHLWPSFILLASLGLAQKTEAPAKVRVADLLKGGAKWDQKRVAVEGTVAKYDARKSRAGNDYLLFDLTSGKETVHVYSFGKLSPAPKIGAKVRVTGIFRVTKKLGARVIKNEIDASPKRGVKDGKPAVILLK